MDQYSFWQDFFTTYRSSPDVIKALWLIVPPAFVIVQTWVILRSPPVRALFKKATDQPTKKPDQLIRLSLLEVPIRANLQRGTLTER